MTRTITPRHTEVLEAIATTGNTFDAAKQLNISPKTAQNHLHAIYRILDVHTMTAAVVVAHQRGHINIDHIEVTQ